MYAGLYFRYIRDLLIERDFNTTRITDKLYYTYGQRYLTVHINCLTANLRPRELVQFWNPRKIDPAKLKHFTLYQAIIKFTQMVT